MRFAALVVTRLLAFRTSKALRSYSDFHASSINRADVRLLDVKFSKLSQLSVDILACDLAADSLPPQVFYVL